MTQFYLINLLLHTYITFPTKTYWHHNIIKKQHIWLIHTVTSVHGGALWITYNTSNLLKRTGIKLGKPTTVESVVKSKSTHSQKPKLRPDMGVQIQPKSLLFFQFEILVDCQCFINKQYILSQKWVLLCINCQKRLFTDLWLSLFWAILMKISNVWALKTTEVCTALNCGVWPWSPDGWVTLIC